MPRARHISGEDADLAVGDLAGRAGILTAHAARRLALLQKAGFVDHQNRIVGAERFRHILAHDIANRIRTTPAPTKDRLLPPRSRITRRLGARPPPPAPLRAKPTGKENTRPSRPTSSTKQTPKPPPTKTKQQ